MHPKTDKPKENKSRAVGNSVGQRNNEQGYGLMDNRSENIMQRKLVDLVNNKLQVKQFQTFERKSNSFQNKNMMQIRSSGNSVIQMAKWTWDGSKWVSDDHSPGAGPRRPGAFVGEELDYDEPKYPLSLNLGAGQNPMDGQSTINLEYSEEDAYKGKEKNPDAEYIISDANNLPFRSQVFDTVHSINPFNFNPVNPETSRVMSSSGGLRVTGNSANKYAKNSGSAHTDSESVGLYQHGISDIAEEHQFGVQSHSGGNSELNVSSSITRSYSKGKGITLSEAANSENPELKAYYELHSKLELLKMDEREEGYQDDYADDDEYLSSKESQELSRLTEKFGELIA